MTLYCTACSQVHEFTLIESERIIYALQAELHDRSITTELPELRVVGSNFAEEQIECLRSVLGASHSVELYGEWTGETMAARRTLVRDGSPTAIKELGTEPPVADWSAEIAAKGKRG